MTEFKIDKTLDCTGMLCPMPIVKTKKALNPMEIGQVLEIISTDAGSMSDMHAWAKQTQHELINAKDEGDKFRFLIKKTH